ncbi:MAG: AI-2E family transporter [Gemmatimonadetes bacterium]|nr:AI-2E family transporter [Gemmatimonadota bacterium]
MGANRFQKGFLILLVVGISAVFLAMIRQFLMTILLAGILTGLSAPLFRGFVKLFRGRRGLASAASLLTLIVVVVGPLLTVMGIVAAEAVRVSETVTPWVKENLSEPTMIEGYLDRIPFIDKVEPYREQVITKASQVVGSTGTWLFKSISATTKGTVAFFFQFALLMYAMFFFFLDGTKLLDKILYYMPLGPDDEERMVGKFVSVTRATLKGTLLIGLLQGGLAGAGFWVAGVDGAVFWGTLMTLLSIIPGIGTALVWVPAVIVLIIMDRVVPGILLAVWCAVVVGSIDNVLRPRLVGRDTEMHDLLILFGTLGGIVMFGVVGVIVGPILAALFVTIWEIYGAAFKENLPAVTPFSSEDPEDSEEPAEA